MTCAARSQLIVDLGLLSLLGVFLARKEAAFMPAFLRNAAARPLAVMATGAVISVITFLSLFLVTVPGEGLDQLGARILPRPSAGPAPATAEATGRVTLPAAAAGLFAWRNLDLRDQNLSGLGLSLRHRDLRYARLDRSNLTGLDLSGANLAGAVLDEADLTGADLSRAILSRATLRSARLDRAQLAGVRAEAASFAIASLAGADLAGANLLLADFGGAGLQGANLEKATLDGARLRGASLEAASLAQASLRAADLAGARIAGADLRGAMIWQTEPPAADPAALADLSETIIGPMDDKTLATLKAAIQRVATYTGPRGSDGLLASLETSESRKWASSTAATTWQAAIQASQAAIANAYKARFTEALAKAVCRPRWSAGHLATGVARRALAAQFRGDPVLLYDKLRADDCPGGKAVPGAIMRDLGALADSLRPE